MSNPIVLCLLAGLGGYALHWLGSSIVSWRGDPDAPVTEVRASAVVLAIALVPLGNQLLPDVAFYLVSASLLVAVVVLWIVTARRAKRRRPAPGWLHH